MSAVNFNMRLEAELKEQVTPILEDYGLTMPQAFKLFLNQIVKTKAILSLDGTLPSMINGCLWLSCLQIP